MSDKEIKLEKIEEKALPDPVRWESIGEKPNTLSDFSPKIGRIIATSTQHPKIALDGERNYFYLTNANGIELVRIGEGYLSLCAGVQPLDPNQEFTFAVEDLGSGYGELRIQAGSLAALYGLNIGYDGTDYYVDQGGNVGGEMLLGRSTNPWWKVFTGSVIASAASDPSNPEDGEMYYNTATSALKIYVVNTWKTVTVA